MTTASPSPSPSRARRSRGWRDTLWALALLILAVPGQASAAPGDVDFSAADRLVGKLFIFGLLIMTVAIAVIMWPKIKGGQVRAMAAMIGCMILLLGAAADLYVRKQNAAVVRVGMAVFQWGGNAAENTLRDGATRPTFPGNPTP